MVDMEWYRTFKAIYRTGTLTGAAQELLISQPNVSQHLASLEAYVGKQLFERKPRRMVPTHYGHLFYGQIVEAVEKLEHVEAEFRYISNSNIPLTCIGAPKEFFYGMLAPRIGKAPANLVFEFGITRELLQKLAKGKVYFVIATQCTDEKDIIYEPILEENFILVANSATNAAAFDKWIKKGAMDEAERWLCEQPWYAYNSDLMIIRRFWLENFRKRPGIRPRYVIPDYNSILEGIRHNPGITVAADFLVNDMLNTGQLKQLWKSSKPARNTIYLAYHRHHATTAQIEMMRSFLKGL